MHAYHQSLIELEYSAKHENVTRDARNSNSVNKSRTPTANTVPIAD